MGTILLLAAIAVAVLLLARLPDLRAVLVAAVVSSVAAGLWLAALPWLPGFGARILWAAPTRRTLVEFVLGAIVVVAQTIVPNLIVQGAFAGGYGPSALLGRGGSGPYHRVSRRCGPRSQRECWSSPWASRMGSSRLSPRW